MAFKDGKGEGPYRLYYPTGQVKERGSYKAGTPHGRYEWYNFNGQLMQEGSFLRGVKTGPYKTYHENGQLEFKVSYKNGKESGVSYKYFNNGVLGRKASWKNGVEFGDLEIYWPNGNLQEKGFAKNGFPFDGVYNNYYMSGSPQIESEYSEGRRHGTTKKYNENGELMELKSYVRGKLNGNFAKYKYDYDIDEFGPVIVERGSYNANQQLEGVYERYHVDGELKSIGVYKDGHRHGVHYVFDQSGFMLERCEYINFQNQSLRDGPCELYSEGMLHTKGVMSRSNWVSKTNYAGQGIRSRLSYMMLDEIDAQIAIDLATLKKGN